MRRLDALPFLFHFQNNSRCRNLQSIRKSEKHFNRWLLVPAFQTAQMRVGSHARAFGQCLLRHIFLNAQTAQDGAEFRILFHPCNIADCHVARCALQDTNVSRRARKTLPNFITSRLLERVCVNMLSAGAVASLLRPIPLSCGCHSTHIKKRFFLGSEQKSS